MASALSMGRLEVVGMAGIGAIGAGFVQNMGDLGLGPNIRDALLVVIGAWIVGTSEGNMRALGLGFGAVPVATLANRLILSSVLTK